jgi:hypothetical protein
LKGGDRINLSPPFFMLAMQVEKFYRSSEVFNDANHTAKSSKRNRAHYKSRFAAHARTGCRVPSQCNKHIVDLALYEALSARYGNQNARDYLVQLNASIPRADLEDRDTSVTCYTTGKITTCN